MNLSQNHFLALRWRGRQTFAILFLMAACVWPARALIIIPTFDSTITSDPNAASIEATINCCIAEYEAAILDPGTVDITFKEMSSGLGQSQSSEVNFSYQSFRTALASHATSTEDNQALSNVPNTANNPVNGSNGGVTMTVPLANALGLYPSSLGGTISLNTSSCNINPETDNNASDYSLFAVACHEIDEVLGTGGTGTTLSGTNGTPAPTSDIGPEDLFRYSFPSGVATRSFNTTSSTVCYFSIDGTASTELAQFNQNAAGDYADFFTGPTPFIQDAFGSPGAHLSMAVEWNILDVVGYHWNGHANIWASASSSGGSGTVYSPYTLALATNAVPSGGVILLKAGTYNNFAGKISTPCKLRAVNGTASIK